MSAYKETKAKKWFFISLLLSIYVVVMLFLAKYIA